MKGDLFVRNIQAVRKGCTKPAEDLLYFSVQHALRERHIHALHTKVESISYNGMEHFYVTIIIKSITRGEYRKILGLNGLNLWERFVRIR